MQQLFEKWQTKERIKWNGGWCFRLNSGRASGALSLLIIDDDIPGSKPPDEYDDAAYVLRAITNGLEHPEVRSVFVSDHVPENYLAAFHQMRGDVKQGRACVLLDVFGPGEKVNTAKPLGMLVAEHLSCTGFQVTRNVAPFSKAGHAKLQKDFAFEFTVPKQTAYKDPSGFKTTTSLLREWLDHCAKYHASEFAKPTPLDNLARIQRVCEEFHRGEKHDIDECLASGIATSELKIDKDVLGSFVDDVARTNHVKKEVVENLIEPLFDPSKFSPLQVFSMSKSLSRRETKKLNVIPAEWVESMMGIEAGLSCTSIVLSEGYSIGGFINAIQYLSRKSCASKLSLGANDQIILDFCFRADERGLVGLEKLAERIEERFNSKQFTQVQGHMVDAATALFCCGFKLQCKTIDGNQLNLQIVSSDGMIEFLPREISK